MISSNGRPSLWHLSSWRISFKLTLFFLVLTLVPLILVTFFVNTFSRNALLSQGAAGLQSVGSATVRQIDAKLADQRELITMVGQIPEVVQFAQTPNDLKLVDSVMSTLRVAASKSPDYESVAIVNLQGKVIISSYAPDIGTDLEFRPYFQEALKGVSYISDPSVSVITNRPAIFFSAPIKTNAGAVVAVVRSRLNLDGLWTLVENDLNAAGTGSYGMMLDENGIRLADSSSKGNRDKVLDTLLFRVVAPLPPKIESDLVAEQRFGRSTSAGVQVVPLPEVGARLANKDTSVFTTRSDVNDKPSQAAIINLVNKPWHYVISAPQASFTAPADAVTVFAVALAALLGAIAVGLALILSRSITRPLAYLAQVADRISLGELDSKITVGSRDEIGDLAEALVRMQASLKAAIERSHARRINV